MKTVPSWYRQLSEGKQMWQITKEQIENFLSEQDLTFDEALKRMVDSGMIEIVSYPEQEDLYIMTSKAKALCADILAKESKHGKGS